MIPLPHASNANNTDLLAQIILKKQEEERLAKQRNFELMNSAIQNSANAYGQLQQQNRAQQLAQMAAGGDRSALLQMGIIPPDLKPKNSILLETPEHAQAIARAKAKGSIEGGKTPKSPEQIKAEAAARAAGTAEGANEDRQYKRQERRGNEKSSILNRFNADPSVKKAQQSIDAANTIRGLVDSNNPIAAAAVPTFMARASGEVGNLSEADKRPFGGSQAILSKLQAAVTQASSGQLTAENAQFIKQLAGIMESRAKSNIDSLAKQRSKQYSAASEFLKEGDIYSVLQPESGGLTQEAPTDTGGWKYLGHAQ